MGVDDLSPEAVGAKNITYVTEYGDFFFTGIAKTADTGPETEVAAIGSTRINEPIPSNTVLLAKGPFVAAQSEIRYPVTIWNLLGTPDPQELPLCVEAFGWASVVNSGPWVRGRSYSIFAVVEDFATATVRASASFHWYDDPDVPLDSFTWRTTLHVPVSHKAGSRSIVEFRQLAAAVAYPAFYVVEWPNSGKSTREAGGLTAMAAVDPLIYIDPTWEYADRFRLEFPSNVVPDVPEPVTVPEPVMLLLLGPGLAGVGARGRRRLRASPDAASRARHGSGRQL